MSLEPIAPQNFTDYVAYSERKRTRWERFLDKIKPRSAAMRTTILVLLVVFFSLFMSLWFFWRTLYLPEIQQHARYLAVELELVNNPDIRIFHRENEVDIDAWLRNRVGIEYVTNPKEYPSVREKVIAEFFTNHVENKLANEIGTKDVTVYFQFKPSPRIWIQTPEMHGNWVREPLKTYANYSPELLVGWVVGVPLLSAIIILILVRQMNRPLRRLQNAANEYSKSGTAPYLDTNHGPLEIRQVNQAFNRMVYTLDQTERERRIMLAGISHDLRTPLTRIRLTAEMLPDEFLREGLVYDVDDMDAILNQFISYMRDGSDEELKDTNINMLLQELVVQFKPLDIQFEMQDVPIIPARSLSLKRLIANLINNAKRYGAEPIELSAKVENESILITVADHGEGIPADQIEELMQPFVRGDSARTIQGSGLGLAIVKRIVDIHHGEIQIHNREQGGLEVIISLPIPKPSTEENTSTNPLEKIKQTLSERF
ncbi:MULTISPECIES: ATP-binding protein [Acinetobacter]|uniref:histidine kinase n=2 Tax=Acinetobacter TaxID=469 RepID=A0A242U504_ACIPI|nr:MULTISPECIES: ATP-binding protein [Acinetobacter]MBJ8433615.1 HAMP domain-containing protein [Acinetobacter pittii]MBJ8501871.1 HAMP domain-containing protein [Acinetobacter pittii]MBJ9892304.1 HAMP domain-containing protein [Acinetobacter pittii]MCU4362307.1 HAMP domain-containing protein [Acinetobacter sp. WU_MDCI_Abxc22]MCU4479981.1 HAMP domain-containing protein [Acinetobacter sp. WU_MDCI_Abxd143]